MALETLNKVFGIHLIHGHFQIPPGTVMLGANFQNPKLRWTKTTEIESIDTASIHGHIFVLTEDGLCPYELQEGPLPNLSKVGHGFLTDFVNQRAPQVKQLLT
ncbi:hypothetical protein F5Y03DRAFT_389749 [Xylaria venustula]|nr:hypothetical protein F5Y03DRAFT_389749 [Xylaria venustula]